MFYADATSPNNRAVVIKTLPKNRRKTTTDRVQTVSANGLRLKNVDIHIESAESGPHWKGNYPV